jgi:hypothetical protein
MDFYFSHLFSESSRRTTREHEQTIIKRQVGFSVSLTRTKSTDNNINICS